MTSTEKYTVFKERYNEAHTAMIEESRAAFKEIATDLFHDNPALENFTFRAYTDYFNDGDTCYYNVHSDWGLGINDEDVDADDKDNELSVLVKPVSEFLETFDDEIIRDIFGDHIRVTVHRDGRADVEEYTDHD